MARVTRAEFEAAAVRAYAEPVNFAGRDLAGLELAGHWLERADFSGASLRGVDLHGARLGGASFLGADLQGADLRRASLRGAWLKRADLSGADLRDADLADAMLGQADLRRASLRGAWLDRVELSGTELPANWQRITRVRTVPDRPYARHDVVAAVRRDLADDDPDAALQTLRHALGSSAERTAPLLARIVADPRMDSLAALRPAEPEVVDEALARLVEPPPRAEVGAQLAALARTAFGTCRRNGLRWTVEQALRERLTIPAIILLRQLGGLGLQGAKVLANDLAERPELLLEVCTQVERGELGAGAERLASALWDVDHDTMVRILWGLRAGLNS